MPSWRGRYLKRPLRSQWQNIMHQAKSLFSTVFARRRPFLLSSNTIR